MQAEVDPTEDTEWNDILRQHGIIPERPKSPTADIEAAVEAAVERAHANRLDGKSMDELDELEEDGLEDEEFVQKYREKRMAEIRAQASRERFGHVSHISKPEYTEEITNASRQAPVFVHISSTGGMQSRLLSAILQKLAPRFRDIKFVDIDCRQINENYSIESTPTVLLYRNGELKAQQVTLSGLGGNSAKIEDIEQFLVQYQFVERTDPRLSANKDSEDEGDY